MPKLIGNSLAMQGWFEMNLRKPRPVPPRILIHQYFYTEIETKILNTDSDPKILRDSDHALYSDLAMKK